MRLTATTLGLAAVAAALLLAPSGGSAASSREATIPPGALGSAPQESVEDPDPTAEFDATEPPGDEDDGDGRADESDPVRVQDETEVNEPPDVGTPERDQPSNLSTAGADVEPADDTAEAESQGALSSVEPADTSPESGDDVSAGTTGDDVSPSESSSEPAVQAGTGDAVAVETAQRGVMGAGGGSDAWNAAGGSDEHLAVHSDGSAAGDTAQGPVRFAAGAPPPIASRGSRGGMLDAALGSQISQRGDASDGGIGVTAFSSGFLGTGELPRQTRPAGEGVPESPLVPAPSPPRVGSAPPSLVPSPRMFGGFLEGLLP